MSNQKTNADQAAFPTELKLSNNADKGLTKLEYFTAAALQGLLASANLYDKAYSFEATIGDAIHLARGTINKLSKINQ